MTAIQYQKKMFDTAYLYITGETSPFAFSPDQHELEVLKEEGFDEDLEPVLDAEEVNKML